VYIHIYYVPLCCYIHKSLSSQHSYICGFHWGSPHERASFALQICISLLCYTYVSFLALITHLYISFVLYLCLFSRTNHTFVVSPKVATIQSGSLLSKNLSLFCQKIYVSFVQKSWYLLSKKLRLFCQRNQVSFVKESKSLLSKNLRLFCQKILVSFVKETRSLLSKKLRLFCRIYMHVSSIMHLSSKQLNTSREVGGWGRDPKKCTGRDWGMGSSTI